MSRQRSDIVSQPLSAICLRSQFLADADAHHYRHTAPSQNLNLLLLGCSIIEDICCQGNDEQREVCCQVFYFQEWVVEVHDD